VRLTSIDGSFLELTITGYQFPDGLVLPSGRTVMPDWLDVTGQVRSPTTTWTFSFPCLHADEAVTLGHWRQAAATEESVRERIAFTEPNVSIELVARSDVRVTLRIHLTQEACPPGESDEVRLGDGYSVDLTIDAAALARASIDWQWEASSFPVRT